MKTNDRFLQAISLILLSLCLTGSGSGQVRSGVAFLKLNPGARQSGIAGSTVAALDYNDSFYTNPAATAFAREWQWSASYTNWISDIYNASLLYGRYLRMPWSRWFRFGIGVNYLGIPEFDSSEGASPLVSGNTVLATVSLGQPLTGGSENLSVGTNIKYFSSELAGFSAQTAIVDFGVLYRTPRMQFLSAGNGFLEHVILSAGASVTNLGSSLKYLSEGTPLPRTLQAGIGVNMGAHDGLQWSLNSDIRKIRDENAFFTIGSEISWSQLINLRFGYSFEDNILGQFTFGASLRLDDQISPASTLLPGRNNALRFDLSANQSSDFSSSPFHGTASQFPIGPEQFRLTGPDFGAVVNSDSVLLSWEATVDRDLYDDVYYRLLVTSDSLQMLRTIALANSENGRSFNQRLAEDQSFLINENVDARQRLLVEPMGGDYYWAVLAYDRDKHTRLADSDEHKFGKFRMTIPELTITNIEFEYSPWITTDDYQGVLKFTVTNLGNRSGRGFMLSVYDSTSASFTSTDILVTDAPSLMQGIALVAIPAIAPGESVELVTDWSTTDLGLHFIGAEILEPGTETGIVSAAHRQQAQFYTIPKGTFTTGDTVLTQSITNIRYELPYVGKIFFDANSPEVLPRFIDHWVIEPLLVTLADRLRDNDEIDITLQGTSDPNSEEASVELADRRANAVRDSLVNLGVAPRQIVVLPGEALPLRKVPADPIDAQRILEERRRVDIQVDKQWESELFRPLQAAFNERIVSPVVFATNIVGIVPLANGYIQLQSDEVMGSLGISELAGPELARDIEWQYRETSISQDQDWQDTEADYALVLVDSLGRKFQSHPNNVYLKTRSVSRERMYFGVSKFAQAEPLYSFYWQNLMARVPALLEDGARLRFIGHACEIGSDKINMDLSKRRAQLFHERFLQDVKEDYSDLYDDIKGRLDPPEAKGETTPFSFKGLRGEVIIIGDNDLPTGRQLNRRVMALIYEELRIEN